jgi:hypothetical protein
MFRLTRREKLVVIFLLFALLIGWSFQTWQSYRTSQEVQPTLEIWAEHEPHEF